MSRGAYVRLFLCVGLVGFVVFGMSQIVLILVGILWPITQLLLWKLLLLAALCALVEGLGGFLE